MKLVLDTITGLGAKGNDKAAVLTALFATKDRNSVLGTYGFDSNGDTTLKSYGLYKVGSDGNPVFVQDARQPSKTRDRCVARACGGAAQATRLHPARLHYRRAVEAGSVDSEAAGGRRRRATGRGAPRARRALGPDRRARWRCRSTTAIQRPDVTATAGLRRTATHVIQHDLSQLGHNLVARHLERHDLGADRDRLHARLRDHRADQLRPRRRVHDRLVHRGRLLGQRSASGSRPGRSGSSLGLLLTLVVSMLVCGSLNVLIERVAYRPLRNAPEARAADHRGRLLVHPAERRAAVARRLAGRRRRPDPPERDRVHDLRRRSSTAPTCSRSRSRSRS